MSSRPLGVALATTASLLIGTTSAGAQDTATTRLEPVVVEVGRGARRSLLELPFAITVQTPDSTRPGQRHLNLDETLWLIPGLTVSNRNNPSQDPRISIRGYGARSAFGVRGIRVLRDGIPLTLPDGQTPVDYLDLESVGRVEVMRGSASSLYGNAGGGVVDLRTSEPMPVPVSAEARLWTGSFATRRFVGKASGSVDGVGYQGNVTRTESDGFRDYSNGRSNSGFGRLSYDNEDGSYALDWLGVNTPVAQNPGALTRAQFETDPQLADPLSIRKKARKAVKQSQFGLTLRRAIIRGEIEASTYVGTRGLDNPLTFGIVDVDRATSGGNLRATVPFGTFGADNRFTIGTELHTRMTGGGISPTATTYLPRLRRPRHVRLLVRNAGQSLSTSERSFPRGDPTCEMSSSWGIDSVCRREPGPMRFDSASRTNSSTPPTRMIPVKGYSTR